MTNEMIVDAKNQLRTIVEVYAKVFLSAEQSPSFEDGVDKQITDRVQQIRVETLPLEKREVYIQYSNTVYLQCVSKYIYIFFQNKINDYMKLGKIDADKQATKVLNYFLSNHKLSVDNLDDVLFQLFFNKIFSINNEQDLNELNKNDQIIKREHIFLKDKDIVIHNPKKVLTLMLEQEDENFKKKAWYKTNGLDVVLKVKKEDLIQQHRIGSANKRGLLINPLDFYFDENSGKYKKIMLTDDEVLKIKNQTLF